MESKFRISNLDGDDLRPSLQMNLARNSVAAFKNQNLDLITKEGNKEKANITKKIMKEKESSKEDIRISNEYRVKVIACEKFQSFLTILHVSNSIVIYEFYYNDEEDEADYDLEFQLYISTLSCLLLIFMLVIRYVLMLRWMKSKRYIHRGETLTTSGMVKPMIVELIITTIGPQIFLQHAKYSEYVYDYDYTVVYPIN